MNSTSGRLCRLVHRMEERWKMLSSNTNGSFVISLFPVLLGSCLDAVISDQLRIATEY